MKILSATPVLGYGFDQESARATSQDIGLTMVGADAGSTDPGPYYLGTGKPLCSRAAVKRDIAGLLEIARANKAPVVVGTCGGSGTDAQVEWVWEIAREILTERGWTARVALIRSEVDNATLVEAVRRGRVIPLDGVEPLEVSDAESAACTVAMMSVEPIIEALSHGADIVLAGRCSDAALFAALPIQQGIEPGTAWCAGKLLECGAACADPFGLDSVIAEYDTDSFFIYPPNESRRCTPRSLADMFLHENANPFLHRESSGVVDLTELKLIPVDDQRGVRVAGARFQRESPYTVRLEGVAHRGHRSVVVAATHDPRLISNVVAYLQGAEERCHAKAASMGIAPSEYRIHRHVYGKNGVLGEIESDAMPTPHEVAVVLEVVGSSPEISQTVAAALRTIMLHTHFPGRQCTEGNFALPFSPPELDGGEVYEFCIWHAIELDDPHELFPIDYHTV